MSRGQIEIVACVTIVVVAFVAALTAANLNWSSSAERIKLAELQVQVACIQQGGIYDGYGKCYWSKRAPAVSP